MRTPMTLAACLLATQACTAPGRAPAGRDVEGTAPAASGDTSGEATPPADTGGADSGSGVGDGGYTSGIDTDDESLDLGTLSFEHLDHLALAHHEQVEGICEFAGMFWIVASSSSAPTLELTVPFSEDPFTEHTVGELVEAQYGLAADDTWRGSPSLSYRTGIGSGARDHADSGTISLTPDDDYLRVTVTLSDLHFSEDPPRGGLRRRGDAGSAGLLLGRGAARAGLDQHCQVTEHAAPYTNEGCLEATALYPDAVLY